MMLRIPSPQLTPDIEVTAAPKAGQIRGDLQRALRRREEVELKRDNAPQARMLRRT